MAQTLTGIVSTSSGPIQGFNKGKVQRFTGIPYAEAERFKRPTPVSPWTATFAATSPCPACPQPIDPVAYLFLEKSLAYDALPHDENCQFLSITRPASLESDTNGKLRVMVFFHGGAFINGAADLPIYEPSKLVAENNVIVVNVGSRMGIFGFLGDADPNSGGHRPCNLGLLDCLEALQWVKNNIASFGGNPDPKTITIFGQSAGASTVGDLLVTSNAPSLFGRAIMQSAPLGMAQNRSTMNKALFSVVKDLTSETPTENIVARSADVAAAARRFGLVGGMAFAPQYGCEPLPAENELNDRLAAVSKEIEVLIGSTSQEASMFVDLVPVVSTLSRLPVVGSFVNSTFTHHASRRVYYDAQHAWYEHFAKSGGRIAEYEVVWNKHNHRERMGATHAIELALLFSDEQALKTGELFKGRDFTEVEADGQKFRRLWADFAKGRQLAPSDSLEGTIKILRSSS